MLDPLLLEVLCCPRDKLPLLWFEDEGILYNPRLRLAFEVHDGIPDMLLDEAVEVDQPRHDDLVAQAIAGHHIAATNGATVGEILGGTKHERPGR